jgi:glycosyltransferase involved in cell wall biosynthesis
MRAMLEGARIAVVVPAHNERRLIARTLRGLPSWVDHVVVVDDASSDDTAEQARAVPDDRVEVVRHGFNRGVGAAIVTGYRHAFDRRADVAAVMAGDAQMDPDDLGAVVMPIVRGHADYVKGDRLSHPEVLSSMPLQRWIANHALSELTRWTTGLSIHDAQCGFTAISRRASELIPLDRIWPRYGYPNDLLSHLALSGMRVRDVVVRPIYGSEISGIRTTDIFTSYPRVLARSAARRALQSVASRWARAAR